MEENYRKGMIRNIKADLKLANDLRELQKRIKKLEENADVKRYLELKEMLETLSAIHVGVPRKIEEEKSYVFDNGCEDQACLFIGEGIGYKNRQEMIMAKFYCLDCGADIDVALNEVEQFRMQHCVINEKPLNLKDYILGTDNYLRDYYFSLLMNYKSEEALRIFILTYEEMLEPRKVNCDLVSR